MSELIGYEIISGEALPLPDRKTVKLDDRTTLNITSDRRILFVKKNIKVTEQVWP
jgi:hypothetical protein